MLRPLPPDPKSQTKFLLALAILLVLLVVAAMGQDVYEADCDLPVDGTLRKKQAPSTVTPPTPEKPPEPPPPPGQEDEKAPTIYGVEVKTESGSYILVVDRSGSLGLDGAYSLNEKGELVWQDRMGRLKAEILRLIASTPESFKFDVIAYDDTAEVLWGELKKADRVNKTSASAFVAALTPRGSTATALAMAHALKIKENKLVILATDGQPNSTAIRWSGNVPPELHREDIKWFNENHAQARIDVFGIACAQGSVMEWFCRGVAEDSAGIFQGIR